MVDLLKTTLRELAAHVIACIEPVPPYRAHMRPLMDAHRQVRDLDFNAFQRLGEEPYIDKGHG